MTGTRASDLLAGPRGRRLCLAVAAGPGWSWPPRGDADPVSALRRAVARVTGAALASGVLWDALVESADSGRYWQAPEDTDNWLADPAVVAQLRPVAEAVAADPGAAWWWEDVDLATQTAVGWPGPGGVLPTRAPVGDPDLARHWSAATRTEEARAATDRPADPAAGWSGCWWSAPCLSDLPRTARTRPGSVRVGAALGLPVQAPVGLHLVEDEAGWTAARTWPVIVRAGARVLEVHGPADWTALVARHPLPVTAARRHDWFRCTGRAGEWLVPDWGSVADEVDAVHVSVAAWLVTAGQALDVPGTPAATVLAGWDPDATWWLTDVVGSAAPTDWVRTDEDPPDRWRAV